MGDPCNECNFIDILGGHHVPCAHEEVKGFWDHYNTISLCVHCFQLTIHGSGTINFGSLFYFISQNVNMQHAKPANVTGKTRLGNPPLYNLKTWSLSNPRSFNNPERSPWE
jgi:hypothetical protein